MSTDNQTKINRLLSQTPEGVVLVTPWLEELGYSAELLKRYKKSGWFKSLGGGALVRNGQNPDYLGGVYALQHQLGLSIHPGGATALALTGKAHFLEMDNAPIILFGDPRENLPLWFKRTDWEAQVKYHASNFIPPGLGMVTHDTGRFSVEISGQARAVMEYLYESKDAQSIVHAYELMEGLNTIRPTQAQQLLEQCRSIRVKRLFLFLADKAGHSWFSYLDISKINCGAGKRSLVKGGSYNRDYQITVPDALVGNAK